MQNWYYCNSYWNHQIRCDGDLVRNVIGKGRLGLDFDLVNNIPWHDRTTKETTNDDWKGRITLYTVLNDSQPIKSAKAIAVINIDSIFA